MIDLTTTLGDLVTEDPRRAHPRPARPRLLLQRPSDDRRGVELNGLDADRVAAAVDLPDPEPAPEWQSLGLTGLADHILDTHHAYLWEELGPLGSLVEKVLAAHGEPSRTGRPARRLCRAGQRPRPAPDEGGADPVPGHQGDRRDGVRWAGLRRRRPIKQMMVEQTGRWAARAHAHDHRRLRRSGRRLRVLPAADVPPAHAGTRPLHPYPQGEQRPVPARSGRVRAGRGLSHNERKRSRSGPGALRRWGVTAAR